MYSLPKIFTEMPPLKGKNIAVVTNSGAFGGITADILNDNDLFFPEFSPQLRKDLTATGKIFNNANPVDIGPNLSKQTLMDIFEKLLKSDEVDGLLPVPNVWNDVFIEAIKDLVTLCNKHNKPAAIYLPNSVSRIIELRQAHQIPIFESPDEAARALKISFDHQQYILRKELN